MDGAYVVYGSTGSFGIAGSCYMLKLDSEGMLIWSNYFDSPGVETGEAILEATDGSFYSVGSTNSTMNGGYSGFLQKITADGELVWQRNLDSDSWEFFLGMDLYESGLFITGTSYVGDSGSRAFVANVDLNGDTLWVRRYPSMGASQGKDVIRTQDGGCIVIGTIEGQSGNSDVLILKYSDEGQLIWNASFETEGIDVANALAINDNNELIIVGSSTGFLGHEQILLLNYTSEGEYVWSRNIGDQIGVWSANEVIIRDDGGYAIIGSTDAVSWGGHDAYLLLTDVDGYYQSAYTYGFEQDEKGISITSAHDQGYVFSGYTRSNGPGTQAVYVVKTAALDSIAELENVIESFDPVSVQTDELYSLSVHPNPILRGSLLSIEIAKHPPTSITLTDLSGRIIDQTRCSNCTSYQIPAVASGSYRLMLVHNNGSRSIHSIVVE